MNSRLGGRRFTAYDSGHLLASVSLAVKGGQWTETQLSNPVMLRQGEVYRVGVFTGGSEYYSTPEAPLRFVDGTILGSFYALGDAFPATMDNSAWYMVDLTYALEANIAPTNTTTFTNGVWTGGISVKDTGTFKLMADDGNGHIGYSNPFLVFATNDLSLYVKTSTTLPLVGSNLIYEVVIVNPGPNTSTSVRLTNTMPANATFVGVSASTGTTSTNGRTVSWDIGSLSGLASATMTLTVKPDVAGVTITNTATVYRNESDPNPSNNTAISILSAGYAMSLLYTEGLENDEVWQSWASGGAIWMLQTNVTHDGVDALQSGPVAHGQSSFVGSGVRGPGILKFWWRVSSDQNGDRFYFYTNGFPMAYITGEQVWQQFSYSVPTSYVAVTWGYVKDGNISAGSDCAWLDQIEYTIPVFQFVSPPILTNGTTRLNIAGTNGQRLILQASQDLKSWVSLSTNIVTGGAISVIDTSSTNYQNRAYRAIHRNEP